MRKGWFELKRNTSVYVTGLPSDVSEEEVKAAFGRCGIIKENEDRTPRIKLYRDSATGMLKGDGLITFLKVPLMAGNRSAASTGLCRAGSSQPLPGRLLHRSLVWTSHARSWTGLLFGPAETP